MHSTALAALLLVPAQVAQEPEPAPDPAAIVRRAIALAEPARSVGYTLEQRVRAGDVNLVVRGEALHAEADVRDAGPCPGLYHLRGTVQREGGAPAPYALAYDGEHLTWLAPEQRAVFSLKGLDTRAALMNAPQIALFALAFPLARPEALEEGLLADRELTYGGREFVGGAECERVTVEREAKRPDGAALRLRTTWSFDVESGWLRAIETDTVRTVVSDLRVDAELPEGSFSVALPEGYERREVQDARGAGGIAQGAPAPELALTMADGQTLALASLRGKVVLLDFWGTWCSPCVRALPHLQALHERFGGRGLVVLGVSANEPPESDPAAFLAARGSSYATAVKGEAAAQAFGVRMFPTVYLLDRDGRVLHAEFGFSESLEADLAALLEPLLPKPNDGH
jgi:peroxiredoxin